MAVLLEEGASLLETDKTQKVRMTKKNQFHRSAPTATTKLNRALILDHNLLPKDTETERISQKGTVVIGNMTNSEATKEEKTTEVPTGEAGK